jgi:hypothetical protein
LELLLYCGEEESAERVTEGIEKIDFEVYMFEEED